MKKTVLFVIFSLIGLLTYTQNQASNWYFGSNASISFNLRNNTINKNTDGELSTIEGCSSISDNDGNLLLYTDGITIWNKNHDVMDNGAGLNGDPSSSQSAIIIPKPNDPDIYYVFTVDDHGFNEAHLGLNYSEIDMTQNGGLGAVTNKNINLLQDCSEKLSAVLKDCFTKSIWVVALASENGTFSTHNTFHAFEVSSLGVSTTSVKSTFPINISDYRGYLKLSPDGKKMASANASATRDPNSINTDERLILYDFDAPSGKASNPTSLRLSGQSNTPYGIEFSPNSKLLYVHASNDFFDPENPSNANNPANHNSTLLQFNLDEPDIQGSRVILDSRQLYRGALQLAPDGKIYRALSESYNFGTPYLGVIENPNEIGSASNYTHNAIDLSPFNSTQGLPPFISSFFNNEIDIVKNGESSINLTLCEGDSYTLISEDLSGADYIWSRDGVPLTESEFDLEVFTSGNYKVVIQQNNGKCDLEGQAFLNFGPIPNSIDYTLVQCDEDGIPGGITTFNLTEANDILTEGIPDRTVKFYTDAARTIVINGEAFDSSINSEIIYVEIVDDITSCSNFSELTLNVSLTNSNNASLSACDDDGIEDGLIEFSLSDADSDVLNGLPSNLNVVYYKNFNDALLENNSLDNIYKNITPYNETIYARVENANNCYGISELNLIALKLPDITTEDTEYYCLNKYPKVVSINAGNQNEPTSNYSYYWSTGETTYEININTIDVYTVTVTNNSTGCSKDRVITIKPSNIATFEAPPFSKKDLSENNTISIFVSGEGTYQYSLTDNNGNIIKPYQDSNTFENVYPGIYTIYVNDIKNNCGFIDKEVSVIGYPKFFTPNNDGVNDTWQVLGVSDIFQPNTKIHIYNRFGKLLKQLDPLGKGWNGLLNGNRLPTDDYWFYIQLQDGRVIKDHFTLKY